MQITITSTTDEETKTLLEALRLLNSGKTIEPETSIEENKAAQPAAETTTSDETKTDETETTKKVTLEGTIIPSFQSYAKTHSREKAVKVLAKFGVKSVRDLKETDYSKVLKLLAV